MNHLRIFLEGGVTGFNLVALSYFFLGNGIYTVLMLLSLRATWVHVRQMTYQGLDALRHSPLTPPVTVIIPAWNEEDVIVNSVRSALQADYPNIHVIVVDDGSTDLTLDRLVKTFGLVKMDAAYHPNIPTAPIRSYYLNPAIPSLLVASKAQGGKPDALNAGINLCQLTLLLQPGRRLPARTRCPAAVDGPDRQFRRSHRGERRDRAHIERLRNQGRARDTGRLAADLAGTISGGRILAQFPVRPYGLASAGRDAHRVGGVRRLPPPYGHRSRRFLPRHGDRGHGLDCSTPSVGCG